MKLFEKHLSRAVLAAVLAVATLSAYFLPGALNCAADSEMSVESVKPAMNVAALETEDTVEGTVSAEEADGDSSDADSYYVIDTAGLEMREDGGELPTGETFSNKKIMNFMIIGTDMRIPNTKDKGRADMAMLMSVNSKDKIIKLASFERALGMPLPGQKDVRLNALMNEGGPELLVEDISKCFLVDIDAYIQVDYDALVQSVDMIGGLDLTFDQAEAKNFNSRLADDSRSKFVAKEGLNHLGGYETLIYCRLRDSDDNWGRQARTRTVMKAIIAKVPTFSLKTLYKLVDNVLPLVSTDISLFDIGRLILKIPAMLKSEVREISIPEKNNVWVYSGKGDQGVYGCDFEAESNRLHEFLNN